jgi:hypothetical protein
MSKAVEVRQFVERSAHEVWEVIRTGANVNSWLAAITSCEVRGDQRFCTLAGGGDLVETIIGVDDGHRIFSYRVDQHPLPIGVMSSMMQVVEAGPDRAEIIWRSTFEASDEAFVQVSSMLENMFRAGIAGLESYNPTKTP